MKLSEAKEWLPIIQAAAEGKTIQANKDGEWHNVDEFVFGLCAYRIKPEPKLVKGAAYLCWDDGGEQPEICIYLGEVDFEHRFYHYFFDLDEHPCDGITYDNWKLFVQPPEALRGNQPAVDNSTKVEV